MFEWLRNILGTSARRYFSQQMEKLIVAGDYEAVLEHAIPICQKCENDISAHYWRALALSWLERFQEALDIADRFERLQDAGGIHMPDAWVTAFERVKCGALNGLHQYDALYCYSSRCLERHPRIVSHAAHQLLATMKLGALTASSPSLHFLDCSVNHFDEAWHFFVLYSAQRDLGNAERAGEIARLALARFPDDAGVQEMATAKRMTRDSESPCVQSGDVRHCRPKCSSERPVWSADSHRTDV
jgi:tetratricopeptide (TPR) repeat protein